MTRKHYILIASVIAEQYRLALTCERKGTVRKMAYAMAAALQATNAAFDQDRFLRACKVAV
jgi:hypothetical protein